MHTLILYNMGAFYITLTLHWCLLSIAGSMERHSFMEQWILMTDFRLSCAQPLHLKDFREIVHDLEIQGQRWWQILKVYKQFLCSKAALRTFTEWWGYWAPLGSAGRPARSGAPAGWWLRLYALQENTLFRYSQGNGFEPDQIYGFKDRLASFWV